MHRLRRVTTIGCSVLFALASALCFFVAVADANYMLVIFGALFLGLAVAIFQQRRWAMRLVAAVLVLAAILLPLMSFDLFTAGDYMVAGEDPPSFAQTLLWLIPLEFLILAIVFIIDPGNKRTDHDKPVSVTNNDQTAQEIAEKSAQKNKSIPMVTGIAISVAAFIPAIILIWIWPDSAIVGLISWAILSGGLSILIASFTRFAPNHIGFVALGCISAGIILVFINDYIPPNRTADSHTASTSESAQVSTQANSSISNKSAKYSIYGRLSPICQSEQSALYLSGLYERYRKSSEPEMGNNIIQMAAESFNCKMITNDVKYTQDTLIRALSNGVTEIVDSNTGETLYTVSLRWRSP